MWFEEHEMVIEVKLEVSFSSLLTFICKSLEQISRFLGH